ncbi:MAG: GatB/YqeY domain-containing protein [Saprospiraceae bacterium]|nr:GatB/YqeY domain-containing protein [Saprospiraceae bacterium]MCF8252329.1 GatB/YqeY domain-containing protein [Saprospiraceae bacterium]MCF8282300.1 GatB/YqeY domain-containing protein [Bacteroidales bacterium]MCF8313762.1 GatB/YqeY domain-containing protein [Saprospiraceae bacterium]MCF8442468.1 GatB/YqeY domain-containing protein [Saprospiraceae bacterium]
MTLEERIMEDLKAAMRNKDEAAKRGIRAIKAAILLAKTDGSGKSVEGDLEIKLLQKLVKTRKDSLEIYEQQSREDLAVVEREEIAVIEKYLPKQLGEAELEALLKNIVATVGATGPQDMGKVMGAATKELAGRADGKLVSMLVKKLLS